VSLGYVRRVDIARLRAIPLFAPLSDAELDSLAEVVNEVEVEQGAALAWEGDFGHALFAVEDGEAEVLQGGATIATLRRGDVFGEIAVLSSGRRTASVVAVTPMRLISLFKPDLWRLERSSPAVAEALRATVRERLEPA
jgi:CRP-like cAMP-binding protein